MVEMLKEGESEARKVLMKSRYGSYWYELARILSHRAGRKWSIVLRIWFTSI